MCLSVAKRSNLNLVEIHWHPNAVGHILSIVTREITFDKLKASVTAA